MMDVMSLSFLIANIIMVVGTLLLVRTVIKNKHLLHGYDLLGAFLTFIALIFFNVGYIVSNQYSSAILEGVTVVYWAFVVAFKLKYKRTKIGDGRSDTTFISKNENITNIEE